MFSRLLLLCALFRCFHALVNYWTSLDQQHNITRAERFRARARWRQRQWGGKRSARTEANLCAAAHLSVPLFGCLPLLRAQGDAIAPAAVSYRDRFALTHNNYRLHTLEAQANANANASTNKNKNKNTRARARTITNEKACCTLPDKVAGTSPKRTSLTVNWLCSALLTK